MKNDLSLYLHIPFCAKKCRYCDFYSVPHDQNLIRKYLEALAEEFERYIKIPAIKDSTVKTVYIGGGTPTVLTSDQLGEICRQIRKRFSIADGVEWTVECNPESFTKEKASVLLENGVTRLSIGVQSMNERELALLGRIHSAKRSREVLDDPVLSGFKSISADVMYGLPGQTEKTLGSTLAEIFESPHVRHISAYELTVAQSTPFGRHCSMLPLPAQETMETITRDLWDALERKGFAQYEISNFAQPGHVCRHNEAYWDHGQYLGLGPAAHSYVNGERWGNVRDLATYLAVGEKDVREFRETIDRKKLAFEMLFLGLRRVKGISEETFKEKVGIDFRKFVNVEKLAMFEKQGLLTWNKPFLIPTKKGLLMADAMARGLA